MLPPITYRWTGEAMEPLPRFRKMLDRDCVVGQLYDLSENSHRTMRSHRHMFAEINEAWLNLPESYHLQFPTAEHLRKFALIKAGFCDVQTFPCGSRAEALRWCERLRPLDPYAIVAVTGSVVTRYTAQSQAFTAMRGKEFQESKDKLLEVLAAMIAVPPADLQANAGRAA